MSYSRWSNSPWYSFWNTCSGPTRGEQVLSLWYTIDYCKEWTYDELKSLDLSDLMNEYPGVRYEEIIEAKKYIDAFVADVDGATDQELLDDYTQYITDELGVDLGEPDVDVNIIKGYN